ncbi:hypothetical protein ABZW30_33425 [Kitasatospora sp. NPDC004669]|uniref:hypothetical protein n=1 Tax=Kitasatospora sp. NPDC004669 TaxID=3154555 RepID=UPI0033AFB375
MREAPEETKESQDHPLSFIFYAVVCAGVAAAAQTSLWDDQVGTGGRRYGAATRFLHAIGPTWISILFGLVATMMLLIGIHQFRKGSND